MKTLTNSDLNTLNLVYGAMLVSSNKKLKKREPATKIEKRCISVSKRGCSFRIGMLGLTN